MIRYAARLFLRATRLLWPAGILGGLIGSLIGTVATRSTINYWFFNYCIAMGAMYALAIGVLVLSDRRDRR